jgi:hypothetical protein
VSSFEAFVDAIATHLGRGSTPGIDESFSADSLEMLLIVVWLDERGADLDERRLAEIDTWGELYFLAYQLVTIGG